MTNPLRLLIFLCAVILTGGISCAKKKKSAQYSDVVISAYRLIDEQRTSEAIELLETSLSEDPSNTAYKAVLASAYAHQAGIRIQTLVPVLAQAEKLKKSDAKAKEALFPTAATQQVDDSILSVASLFNRFSGVSEVYAAIPVIEPKQATYLTHAISLLDSIGPEITAADALYRAVLRVVLFKHILAESLIGEFIAPSERSAQTCRLELGHVNDSVIKLGKLLIGIYADIGHANPDNGKDTLKMALDTAQAVSNFTIATTAVTVLDEAASLFLKQSIIQNGFGKIIKCGGS